MKNNKCGKSTVLIGIQYGDEGKARVLDYLLKYGNYDVVARFNGGANAGHTLEVNGIRIALHQVPSGIFYENMILYYGSGCVLNPIKFMAEIKDIELKGISLEDRLIISPNVPLVKPSDILFDKLYGATVGTTGNGIGSAYADVAIRIEGNLIKNIRLADYLSNPKEYKRIVSEILLKLITTNNLKDVNVNEQVEEFDREVLKLKKYMSEDPLVIQRMIEDGKNVFFEGANSTMLDPIMGSVPFVTSSRTLSSAAYVGGDVSNKFHSKTVAVVKAIMSRVGNGPFISEFGGKKSELYCAEENGLAHTKEKEFAQNPDPKKILATENEFDIGLALRMIGGEYGATTKRPRRIGALDLVMIKQNAKLNGVDGIFINKVDSLVDFKYTKLKGIPIVTAYELNGKVIDFMPTAESDLRKITPIIEYLPFIKEDVSEVRNMKDLPEEAINFINFFEKNTGISVLGIGVGPKREQFIFIKKDEFVNDDYG